MTFTAITPPPLTVYVIWHPDYAKGSSLAERLFHHFASHRYANIVGGAGVSVIFRSARGPDSTTPVSIEWDEAEVTAAVLLIDNKLASDPDWVNYIQQMVHHAESTGLGARVLPVTMESEVLGLELSIHATRWDRWTVDDELKEHRLIQELTSNFIRMLRHHLALLQHPGAASNLAIYLQNVKIFLSHSKHDEHGVPISDALRDWLYQHSSMESFLDVNDIPAGLSFSEVLRHTIQISVLLVIYTDSYSSRDWCCYEVVEAKLNDIPMLVLDCLEDIDTRSLPYLGNVPVVRMDPNRMDRFERAAGLVLDEVFKEFLWRCRVEKFRHPYPDVVFKAHPPELISLAAVVRRANDKGAIIVYPDPPLSTVETSLLSDIAPNARVFSLTQWLVEVGG